MEHVPRRTLLRATAATAAGALVPWGAHRLATATQPLPRFGLAVAGLGEAGLNTVDRVTSAVDAAPSIVTAFTAWEWRQPFPGPHCDAVAARGALPQLTWEPWDPRLGGAQPRYRLDRLSAYDAYVDLWSAQAASWGGQVNLRFAHEMNGDWYPWSVHGNGNTQASYVAAYRRLHHRVAAAGATNISWTWCPNIILNSDRRSIVGSYPGDDVVDIVALDGYRREPGMSPEELLGDTIALLRDVAPNKPLWINEVGCDSSPDKAAWLLRLFHYLSTTGIDAVIWFEVRNQDGPDWTLLENERTRAAAARAIDRWTASP